MRPIRRCFLGSRGLRERIPFTAQVRNECKSGNAGIAPPQLEWAHPIGVERFEKGYHWVTWCLICKGFSSPLHLFLVSLLQRQIKLRSKTSHSSSSHSESLWSLPSFENSWIWRFANPQFWRIASSVRHVYHDFEVKLKRDITRPCLQSTFCQLKGNECRRWTCAFGCSNPYEFHLLCLAKSGKEWEQHRKEKSNMLAHAIQLSRQLFWLGSNAASCDTTVPRLSFFVRDQCGSTSLSSRILSHFLAFFVSNCARRIRIWTLDTFKFTLSSEVPQSWLTGLESETEIVPRGFESLWLSFVVFFSKRHSMAW